MVGEEIRAAIAAASETGNLDLMAKLRALLGEASQIQAESGVHEGQRWTAVRPGLPPEKMYPATGQYTWRGEPALAVEFGSDGDLVLVDPWSGDSLRLESVFGADGHTPFGVGIRRAFDIADATGWLVGRAQQGRAGQVRETG